MMDSATINPDGTMVLHGYERQRWRLLYIRGDMLVFHSPGGHWTDNGGRHYGAAHIEIKQITELRRGNVEGSWQVKFKRAARFGGSFHPTPKEACREAMRELQWQGDKMAERVDDIVAGK